MKLSACQRIEKLFDENSFQELFFNPASFYLAGQGKIDGREVLFIATRSEAPEQSEDACASIAQFIRFLAEAEARLCPVVMLFDTPPVSGTASRFPSDPARLLAGESSVGRAYYLQSRLLGRVPLISVVLGKIGSAMSFLATLSDLLIMSVDSGMCIGRPDVVRQMTGEETSYEALAGAAMHCSLSGSGDRLAANDAEALSFVKDIIAYLPPAGVKPATQPEFKPPAVDCCGEALVPKKIEQLFDIRPLLRVFLDQDSLFELKAQFAGEAMTALGRVEGRPFGIIANNSLIKGGVLFPDACRKMTRFINFCTTFKLPLLFLADVPGFMVGTAVEQDGIIKAGADLFAAIANSETPKLSLIVRKAHSAGVYAMAGAGFDAKAVFLLPDAYISIYGRNALESLAGSRTLNADEQESLAMMLGEIANPQQLVAKGLVDGILPVAALRQTIADFLAARGRFA